MNDFKKESNELKKIIKLIFIITNRLKDILIHIYMCAHVYVQIYVHDFFYV